MNVEPGIQGLAVSYIESARPASTSASNPTLVPKVFYQLRGWDVKRVTLSEKIVVLKVEVIEQNWALRRAEYSQRHYRMFSTLSSMLLIFRVLPLFIVS
jgi:hypothetical protein